MLFDFGKDVGDGVVRAAPGASTGDDRSVAVGDFVELAVEGKFAVRKMVKKAAQAGVDEIVAEVAPGADEGEVGEIAEGGQELGGVLVKPWAQVRRHRFIIAAVHGKFSKNNSFGFLHLTCGREVRTGVAGIFFDREGKHGPMANKQTAAEKRAKGMKSKTPATEQSGDEKNVVQKIRENVEKKLSKGVQKASLADYIRLVQLEKQMTDAEPKETKAKWVDHRTTKTSESEK